MMEKFRNLMAYFQEYDLYAHMLSTEIRDKSAVDVPVERCTPAFLRTRMELDKRNRIFNLLKGRLPSGSAGSAKKTIESFVAGEISLNELFQELPLKKSGFQAKLKDEVNQIAQCRSFSVVYPVCLYKTTRKQQPLLTFSCRLSGNDSSIDRVYLNRDVLALVVARKFGMDFADTRELYRQQIDRIATAIDTLRPTDSLMDAYRTACAEWERVFEGGLEVFQTTEEWQMMAKATISFGDADRVIDSCFREEMETVQRFCEASGMIPDTLRQYLGIDAPMGENIAASHWDDFHLGSYQENYPVNQKQWELVQMSGRSRILCVDGPPGTGKTTLLKEMIADTLVQKAQVLVEAWDTAWVDCGEDARHLQMCPVLGDNDYSIIISSTNNKAIDNIGIELLKEIPFFDDFMRSSENPEGYSGSLCARLGDSKKRDAFFQSMYQPFCNYLREKERDEACVDTVKDQFRSLLRSLTKINGQISSLLAFRGQSLPITCVEELESLRQKLNGRLSAVQENLRSYRQQQTQNRLQLSELASGLHSVTQEISSLTAGITAWNEQLRALYADLEAFQEIKGIRKHLGFLVPAVKALQQKYGSARQIEEEIAGVRGNIKTAEGKIADLGSRCQILSRRQTAGCEQQERLAGQISEAEADLSQYTKLRQTVAAYQTCVEALSAELDMDADTLFTADAYTLRNRPALVHLRHSLFNASLAVFEQYILDHREPILQNLNLFLSKQQGSNGDYLTWCSSQFNGNDPYPPEKADRVRMLWKTFFLCFPVLTTTLHSFRKGVFQMIPGLFDLLLVDESGQILPYYVAAPLYRARRAVLVGDVDQIEPIRGVPEEVLKGKYEVRLGPAQYARYSINASSAQSYAALASDFCETVGDHTGGVILNEHRRCEPAIMAFSNRFIYSGVLRLIGKDDPDKLFGSNLIALDIRGFKEKQHCNLAEIDACKAVIGLLKQVYGEAVTKDIGIITPFKRQAEKLKEAIAGIDIGTVHVFQGAEKKYILFSGVIDSTDDTRGLAQFIGGQGNLLNVAFSRAKKQFIYIGNLLAARNAGNYLTRAVQTIEAYGKVFSLFDMEDDALYDEKVLRVLAGSRGADGDGKIDRYLQENLPHGVIDTPQLHNVVLKDLLNMAEQSVHIISPWIGRNVVTDELLNTIGQKLKAGIPIHITFGYRAAGCSLENIDALVEKEIPWNKAGAAEAIRALKLRLEEKLRYLPPSHVKLLLVDDRYLFIGSLNWLYNSGKTQQRELSCLVTNKDTIRYVRQRFLE